MCVKSLPKTVTRQRRDCDLNPGPSAPEFSTLTTRLPSHSGFRVLFDKIVSVYFLLKIYLYLSIGNGQPCRTVPIVSAQFRSQLQR